MLKRLTAFAFSSALLVSAASAQETTIKFTLGWKTQGSDAAFFYAKDKGYFKAEGLNVVIDQGEGSGATVTRIMSGAWDAGFGDVNAIIQNASTKPQDAPVMVYMMWNQPPFAIVAATIAICSGEASTLPCPIATFAVRLGRHLSRGFTSRKCAGPSRMPAFSPESGTPVSCPSPSK